MMFARTMALLYAAALAVAPALAADSPRVPPRVGVLSLTSPTPNQEGFREALRDLGYVEGKNIVTLYRFANGNQQRLDEFAAEMVRDKVNVLVGVSPPGSVAARKATSTIPIVFVSISDPVRMGLVQSVSRPGGNVTGVMNMPADLNLKRLEMLKEVLPALRRVAIVSRTGNPNHANLLDEQARFARSLGLQPLVLRVAGREEFDAAFTTMAEQKIEAVCLLQDNVFYEHRLQFLAIAAKFRLPVIGDGKDYADSGALITYGVNYRGMWRRAAVYVDKILKGAKPAELPLDQPMDLELAVNQRIARNLGIKVPVSIMTLANHVID